MTQPVEMVRCVDADYIDDITEGNTYPALKRIGDNIQIIDDAGDLTWLLARRFTAAPAATEPAARGEAGKWKWIKDSLWTADGSSLVLHFAATSACGRADDECHACTPPPAQTRLKISDAHRELIANAPKMFDLIADFGDGVTDVLDQMLMGDWIDSEGHHVTRNTAMLPLKALIERAIELRAAIASKGAV